MRISETDLVSGSTLLYTASGSSSLVYDGQEHYNVVYPLWINESEVGEVVIEKYRFWQEQVKPEQYEPIKSINESNFMDKVSV